MIKTTAFWKGPKKTNGITHPKSTHRFPTTYSQALNILAEREKKRLGLKKLSPVQIIMTLTMEGGNEHRSMARELGIIYETLNKEQRREHQPQHPNKQASP